MVWSWESALVPAGIEDTHSHLHNNKSVVRLEFHSVFLLYIDDCAISSFFFLFLFVEAHQE